jgi:hypothetical protein
MRLALFSKARTCLEGATRFPALFTWADMETLIADPGSTDISNRVRECEPVSRRFNVGGHGAVEDDGGSSRRSLGRNCRKVNALISLDNLGWSFASNC